MKFTFKPRICTRGAVVAQWIRPWTLTREVPGLNLLVAAVVPLGKTLYPHCLVPPKGLKAIGPLVKLLISKQPGDKRLQVLSEGLGNEDKVSCPRALLSLPADLNRGPHD